MEVHAHTHTPRKKWTHYFWEFLMLFLAVFCGFIAENEREHFIENKREKKYMISMLSDLRSDSISLKFNADFLRELYKGLDTLIDALRKPLTNKKNLDLVYIMYLKYGMMGIQSAFNENTISQLKNAGGMRIIRKEGVVFRINEYEKRKQLVIKQSDDTWKLLTEIENNKANYIFDFTGTSPVFDLLEAGDLNSNTDSLMKLVEKDQLKLLSNDPKQIAIFRNAVRSSKSMMTYYLNLIRGTSYANTDLINELKKGYKLK